MHFIIYSFTIFNDPVNIKKTIVQFQEKNSYESPPDLVLKRGIYQKKQKISLNTHQNRKGFPKPESLLVHQLRRIGFGLRFPFSNISCTKCAFHGKMLDNHVVESE